MKSIVIFFDDKNSKYKNEKIFNGKSALEESVVWAENLCKKGLVSKAVTVSGADSVSELFGKMSSLCIEESADFAVFAWNDLPFLNEALTQELINTHLEYKAEYTFADGYPYGFAPEIIDAGVLKILYELSKANFSEEGNKKVCRESLYNFIKQDINSFEVETVIADDDWRLFRFSFDCGSKEHFTACKNLLPLLAGKEKLSVNDISKIASKASGILKTVPAFYNIQISDFVSSDCIYSPYCAEYSKKYNLDALKSKNFMPYDKFAMLVDKAANFSENAVIGLSLWGEALSNPDCLKMIEKVLSYKGLSVFIETDGLFVTDDFCAELQNIQNKAEERTNGWAKIMIAVQIDAFSDAVYKSIHKNCRDDAFGAAVASVSKLCGAIGANVYPQFVRMNQNEDELEGFFRYWSEKSNASGGNLIIQKYDDFAGLLPECKPADLSPLERNVCWHLRRDMNILLNGDVTLCKTCLFDEIKGNAFENSLEEIWQNMDDALNHHISENYCEKCRKCDEYYTYNF